MTADERAPDQRAPDQPIRHPRGRDRQPGDRQLPDRRVSLAVLLIGLVGIAVVQHAAPIATPPLFDGVVVLEPYRWLVPRRGQPGDPSSAQDTAQVGTGNASPTVIVATSESPPQAQMFAAPGELALPAGTTTIDLSIEPILPRTVPARGHISGNVYRVAVTNQDGTHVKPVKGSMVTVVIRGPEVQAVARAKIGRLTERGWVPLVTSDAGLPATYLAVVSDFGDFALIEPGAGAPYPTATPSGQPSPSPTPSPTLPASRTASAPTTPSPSATPTPSLGSATSPSPTGPGRAGSPAASPESTVLLVAIAGLLGATFLVGIFLRRRRPGDD